MLDRYPVPIGAFLFVTGGYAAIAGDTAVPVAVGAAAVLGGIYAAVYGFLRTDFARLGRIVLALVVPAIPAAAIVTDAWPITVGIGPGLETVASTIVYLAGAAFAVLVLRILRISDGQHDTELVTAADLEDDTGP